MKVRAPCAVYVVAVLALLASSVSGSHVFASSGTGQFTSETASSSGASTDEAQEPPAAPAGHVPTRLSSLSWSTGDAVPAVFESATFEYDLYVAPDTTSSEFPAS